MSKPLTMTVEQERNYRACCTSGGTEVDPVFAELDATRAALAAAEAKLELQGYEYTKALAEVELALGADIHALDAKLADERKQHAITTFILEDERKHADALATEYAYLYDDPEPTEMMKAHAARRAAEASDDRP